MDQHKQKRVWINQDTIDGPHCMFQTEKSISFWLNLTMTKFTIQVVELSNKLEMVDC